MKLVWYCKTCGVVDPVPLEDGYEDDDVGCHLGDTEECVSCPSGMAEVVYATVVHSNTDMICGGRCEPMCRQCHSMADQAADDRYSEG